MKLQELLRLWHIFARSSAEKLKEGIPFTATRTGMAYFDGQCAIHRRILRVHADHVAIWTNPEVPAKSFEINFGETPQKTSQEAPQEAPEKTMESPGEAPGFGLKPKRLHCIQLSELKAVTQGTKHNKRNVEFRLRNGVVEVYKLSNPWGFLQLFELQWTKLAKVKAQLLPKPRKAVEKPSPFPEEPVHLPTQKESEEAVGELKELFPPMKWIYGGQNDKLGLFAPRQAPWRKEWLTLDEKHRERQTYEQWKRATHALPGSTGKSRIYFIGVGDFDDLSGEPRVDKLAEFARAYFFGLKVEMLPPMRLKGERLRQDFPFV